MLCYTMSCNVHRIKKQGEINVGWYVYVKNVVDYFVLIHTYLNQLCNVLGHSHTSVIIKVHNTVHYIERCVYIL